MMYHTRKMASCWPIFLWWLSRATTVTATVTATATAAAAAVMDDPHRNLAVYALYNIPPFAVTFTTLSTSRLEDALIEGTSLVSETNGQESSLSAPIREITQDFLLEQFQLRIPYITEEETFYEIYDHLVAVDLQTKLYVDYFSESSQKVTLVAEMYGTIAFLEPADKSTKPTNEVVRALFGTWIEASFQNHRDQYLRELVQAEQNLLREISSLEIETDIDQNSASSSGKYVDGWSSRTEKALLIILILLGAMAFCWMLLYLRQRLSQRKHKHKLVSQVHEDEPDTFTMDRPAAITAGERNSSMDAVRHGSDTFHRSSHTGAMSVLEASDRYLSKHRPDLYQAGENGNQSQLNVFGRNYAIPSNPFEYIYNSAFAVDPQTTQQTGLMASPRGAFTPRGGSRLQSPSNMNNMQRRSSLEMQKENIASVGYEDQEEHDLENVTGGVSSGHWKEGGYMPISTIWRNLSRKWDDSVNAPRERPSTDGLVVFSQEMEPSYDDIEQQMEEEQHHDYNFAFQDFPRHDGTPCLIYNEDALKQKEIFVIGSPRDNNNLDDDPTFMDVDLATTPVSDSAFQRMLSQHSTNSNRSFEDTLHNEADFGISPKSPRFKGKLDRLMQQKHRQYEKKAIVERHREQRARERKTTREEERRDRHKAMEAEIEAIEATFSLPLERSRAMQMSPKVSASYSPKQPYISNNSPKPSAAASASRQQYSPKVHHSYRNAFSPYGKTNTTSPIMRTTSDPEELERRSPAYRSSGNSPINSGVFRPPPKTSYRNTNNNKYSSSRSLSPPGEMENETDYQDYQMPLRQTRSTNPSSDLYVDTSYGRGAGGNSSMDNYTLDKLSMPPMSLSNTNNAAPKYPSPNSIMDDIGGMTHQPPPRKHHPKQQLQKQQNNKQTIAHRRVTSFNMDDIDSSKHRRNKSTQNLPPPSSSSSSGGISNNHRRTPSKGHKRCNSNQSSSNNGGGHHGRSNSSNGGHHGRSNSQASSHNHSRSNSHSDDVFLHGIFAQTRFV